MFRLSWDPSALSASAMLPPFRDVAPRPGVWNRTATLADIASDRIAALRDLRIVRAADTIGARVLAAAERMLHGSTLPFQHTVPTPTIEDFAAALDAQAEHRDAFDTITFIEPPRFRDDDGSSVERLFDDYRRTISHLAERYPAVRLVAMTASLGVDAELTVGRMIARSLGRDREFGRNRRRNHFNRLLLDELTGRMPIFDLARLESTRPDGTRTFDYDGADPVYSLAPEYADRNGQLNETAERLLGEQALAFLAGLPSRSHRAISAAR
jgi:hypothetical protein